MSDHAEQRRAMRVELRERRAALSPKEQADVAVAVRTRLARIVGLERAQVVGGYRAIRGEVDLDAALTRLHDGGAMVTVPRVSGDRLDFLPWSPTSETVAGSFGIDEPINGEPVQFSQHDVVLVPLVAFDGTGQRLGQGGGFYDRAIAAAGAGRPLLIGVAHAFQQVRSVPVEAWDMPLDAVVTEERVHEFRAGCLS
ncbi:MAG TPA: 5-formyltetrahydrofolate cyclo-ligase [Acidimicrobiaceae bacterium]|nr:5-formyltetrahydrofolate cyclo-ligase [Acidimicrobiaceae bacterium]